MNVIVYTAPACVMCNYTKTWLKKLGIEFEERDVTTRDDWHDEAKAIADKDKLLHNYPIVVVGNHHRRESWSGFKIEKLKGLRETGDY